MASMLEKKTYFEFSYNIPKGKTISLKIPLILPVSGLITDHAEVHITDYRVPCFAEDLFREKFLEFVVVEEDKIKQCVGDDVVAGLDKSLDDIAVVWESNSRPVPPVSNDAVMMEEEFGKICHTLIHSAALPAMRAEEGRAALELRDVVKQRNLEIKKIQEHHIMAMEGYVNNGTNVDTDAVNDLAASQIEQRQNCEVKWASEISHLMEEQRKNYYSWVMKTYEESLGGKEFSSSVPTPNFTSEHQLLDKMEESFSICIGSQLKITHNMRLFVHNIWNLCSGHPSAPERLQTALSLYTNSLAGLILLVDNRLNLYSGNTHKLSKICEMSPEFHFPPFDHQLTTIRQKLLNPQTVRRRTPTNYLIDETIPHSVVKEDSSSGDLILPTGTCYLTRHSNLKQVHLIFHLASTVKELHDDLTSRDVLLVGLKSALKIASENCIDNLTIPLFLCNNLESNMDKNWCVRRAELVFKCVKGFMIENGSTGSIASKTFQFILPKNTPVATFQAVCTLLPTIFRVPCPMVLDQNSRKRTLGVKELVNLNSDSFK